MLGANFVFTQCGIARHHLGAGIFKLPTWKADVTWEKGTIQIIQKYCLVDKKLRARLKLRNAYVCELHY